MFSLKSIYLSQKSPKDKENEDSLLADDTLKFYLVSDGVGSYQGASKASKLVIETAKKALSQAPIATQKNQESLLREIYKKTAIQLNDYAKSHPQFNSMSATLSLLWIQDTIGWISHIGDSRIYLYREGVLKQLTRDHTLAFEQYENGAFAKDEIGSHPNQRLHTRSLSARNRFAIADVEHLSLQANDCFLLCSDGIHKVLNDATIARFLSNTNFQNLPEALIQEAIVQKSDDDITVMVVKLMET